MVDAPFIWGAGGRRLTADQIDAQRKMAASLMTPDYSPIASPWQGLARVAGNITGALQQRRADKAADANTVESQSVVQALLADGAKPDPVALTAAAFNPYLDETARKFAGTQMAALNKPAAAPHYWETNNGSLGVVGPDGRPTILYQDPTPKIDWITTTNPDGTKTLVPMQQGGGMASPSAPAAMPTAPVGKLTPIGEGGQTPPASGSFR